MALNKRIESLVKKANELKILCEVDIAIILQDLRENNEALWASQEEVEEIVTRFSTLPAVDKGKKSTTLESYLTANVKNKYEKNKKIAKKNDNIEMTHLLKEFINKKMSIKDFDMRQTNSLVSFLGDAKKILEKKNQEFDKMEQQHQSHSAIFASHSHDHFPRHQLQQQQPHATLDREVQERLINDNSFMETTYENQRVMDFFWESNVGSSQSTNFVGGGNNWDFYQTNVGSNAENNACLSSPKENANSSVKDRNE
ncbi:hypothetical protein ACH5RR_005703 [Cinchona calisaya]|uniref:MADS-box domain-containing protein n=1 Tax=Cinchona calisaya TaxID=153742 RepID=A0ABD3AM11_9GENT